MFVAVAKAVAEHRQAGAVRIHARGKAPSPDAAIVALGAGEFRAFPIRAANAVANAVLGGEVGAGVAVIEVPLAVRAGHDGVQTVVVLLPKKPLSRFSRLSFFGSNFRSPSTSVSSPVAKVVASQSLSASSQTSVPPGVLSASASSVKKKSKGLLSKTENAVDEASELRDLAEEDAAEVEAGDAGRFGTEGLPPKRATLSAWKRGHVRVDGLEVAPGGGGVVDVGVVAQGLLDRAEREEGVEHRLADAVGDHAIERTLGQVVGIADSRPLALRADAEALASPLPALLADAEHLAASVLLGDHGRRRAGLGDTFWQYRPAQDHDEVRNGIAKVREWREITYGFSTHADLRAENIEPKGGVTHFGHLWFHL